MNDNILERTTTNSSYDHYNSIIKLKEIYDQGIITREKFDDKKKKHINKF